jgi:ubiquinone/menaquinone biosynthesis C-methylase UbiE
MTAGQGEATGTQEHVAPPEAWDAIAEGYDRYVAPQEIDLANEALRLVRLQPGQRFLDVAAGTGGLSLPAARLGAQVLATDWSPAMIERFGARVREEDLSNAAGRVMDCHALELRDDGFDVTGSQFGVMLVPDQPRALRELVRVTKPGGRVLVIAYGSPAELEFLQIFIGALTAVAPEFPGLPDDPPPLEFQVSDPDVLRRRLTDAGLKDVRVERTAERPALTSGQENVGLGAVRQPDPGHARRRPHREPASPLASGPGRHGARARRSEPASRPHERGQHRHRDEVEPIDGCDPTDQRYTISVDRSRWPR